MSVSMSVSARTIERELSFMRMCGIIRRESRINAGHWIVVEHSECRLRCSFV